MNNLRRQPGRWASVLVLITLALCVAASLPLRATAQGPSGPPSGAAGGMGGFPPIPAGPCGALQSKDFSQVPDAPTAIVSTAIVAASGQQPEYCDIKGMISPQIQFELQLPTNTWNGRYLEVGCGGYCGSVQPSSECAAGLAKNFAVGFDNSGHVGTMGGDGNAFWALNEPGLRRDFGYRSEHAMAVAAKAIMAAFYGKGPSYSYYQGCSNGGRQSAQEAQRWPDDFNGVIVGDAAMIQAPLNGEYEVWNGRVNTDAQGQPIITSDKLALINNAVLANCDGLDGLVDGQITDPRLCTFTPESLRCAPGSNPSACLTDAQVEAAKKLYSGPVDAGGAHLYPGSEPPGSELGWSGWVVPSPPGQGFPGVMSQGIGDGYLKYLAFEQSPPPSYSSKDWQFTLDGFNQLRPMGLVYNATNADLSAFQKRGGKMILYHGWADPAIPPYGTVAYYQALVDTMGGLPATQQFARLFMVPGMFHCSGGDAPTQFDMLTPIQRWVEQGIAPDQIIAAQLSGGQQSGGFSDPTAGGSSGGTIVRTRPLCPYPLQQRYKGQGDINDAANFTCELVPGLVDGHYDWVGNDLFGSAAAAASAAVTSARPGDALPPAAPEAADAQAPQTCQFQLGFAALHAQIAAVVGACRGSESYDDAGNASQMTANGMLQWRKADNLTAFTNGAQTWVSGPCGVEQRLNTERFAWEANPDKLPLAPSACRAAAP
ncbi:MAG: tannase/feruloyl esterase family alpha/beta hydrolase [Anaerolineae bacterium]